MLNPLYSEKIRSNKTSLLFVILALIFLALFAWRYSVVGFRFVPGLYAFLGLFFCVYVINYRVLIITITDQALHLKFGLVGWRTDIENIAVSVLYDPPFWIKYGGAGVHFAMVEGEYKAFYNFLEYPRVLIKFHQKQGSVQALVFTTREPDQILEILEKRSPTA
ncbi:MAG: hypothetical protein J7L35_12015 [Anaerolineales bacterium]|nr:hypothetical protein [Anaerolineales bacterium]